MADWSGGGAQASIQPVRSGPEMCQEGKIKFDLGKYYWPPVSTPMLLHDHSYLVSTKVRMDGSKVACLINTWAINCGSSRIISCRFEVLRPT